MNNMSAISLRFVDRGLGREKLEVSSIFSFPTFLPSVKHSMYLPDNGQIARIKKLTFVIDDIRRFSSSLQEDYLGCRRLKELWTKYALDTGIVPLRILEYILVLLLTMADQRRSIKSS